VVVTRRALELYTAGDHDPEDTAMLLSNLGNRLIDVDDFDAALPILAEAARLRRQLAAPGDAQQRADLANTLSSLASALTGVGQYEDAVERAYESVGLLRELGNVDLERFAPDFVAASINLAKPLLDTARSAEALALLAEAVRLSNDLVEADADYLPCLAGALEQQGYALDRLGRAEEGFVVLEKSAGIYRVLAEKFPDEFADSFTTLLGNLAGILRGLNRNEEGLAHAQEALDTAERLVAIYGDRFEPLLANVHNNRGIVLGHSRLYAQAEDEIRKALRIYRKLANRRPEVYLPDVALTLGNHALHLRELGQIWDAVAEDTESADIYRKLAGPRPELLPDLVDALIRLYLHYDELSELGRAHEAIAEAVSITRQLMASDPETSRPQHATALQHLAANLVALDRTAEAVTAARASLSAGRVLARQQPDLFDGLAAETAHVLGLALAASQRYRKARHAYAEALGRYRRLAERDADTYRVDVAAGCTDLAVTQQALGDRRGGVRRALRSNRIAETILHELIKAGHELDGSLGLTLDNLAAVLAKLGHEPEAVDAVTEAVVRCHTAYRRQPELFQVGFWSALRHNAHLLGPAAIKKSVALLAEAYAVAMSVNDDAVRRDMLAAIRDDLSEYPAPAARRAWSELSDHTYRSHSRTARCGRRGGDVATTGPELAAFLVARMAIRRA
jgi:Tetratricopeptide repeat